MLDLTSMEIVYLMHQRGHLKDFLNTLNDDELDIIYRKVINSSNDLNISEIVRGEIAYRYYSKMLEGLVEGKSK